MTNPNGPDKPESFINIKRIKHEHQRYDTCGDWWLAEEQAYGGTTAFRNIEVRVSSLERWDWEALIAIHEMVEALWCTKHSVTTKEVDEFDKAWKPHDGITEPGEDPMAPYYPGHQLASRVERILAANLDVKWQDYEDAINALEWRPAASPSHCRWTDLMKGGYSGIYISGCDGGRRHTGVQEHTRYCSGCGKLIEWA